MKLTLDTRFIDKPYSRYKIHRYGLSTSLNNILSSNKQSSGHFYVYINLQNCLEQWNENKTISGTALHVKNMLSYLINKTTCLTKNRENKKRELYLNGTFSMSIQQPRFLRSIQMKRPITMPTYIRPISLHTYS